MKTLDTLSGFAFGEGAFMEDGAPVNVEFSNCEMTLWVRPLDGNAIADLAEEGVDLSPLFQEKQETDEVELRDDAIEAIKRNREQYRAVVRRLVVKFEGLKRIDGTPIECSDQTIDGFAGYPEIVITVIAAALMVARDISGNSESSSDGNDTQTTQPDGEPTPETDENPA
jgi:hypothetical protein